MTIYEKGNSSPQCSHCNRQPCSTNADPEYNPTADITCQMAKNTILVAVLTTMPFLFQLDISKNTIQSQIPAESGGFLATLQCQLMTADGLPHLPFNIMLSTKHNERSHLRSNDFTQRGMIVPVSQTTTATNMYHPGCAET
jgi:hypothetical protein